MVGKIETRSFGFYETPVWVSDIIASSLQLNRRAQVIDLGAGKGSLLKSIKGHYPGCLLTAIEIDERHFSGLSAEADEVYQADLVNSSVPLETLKWGRQRSIISNPPFGKLPLDDALRSQLIQAGLLDPNTISRNARLEVLFLARALECVKKGAQVVFIMPSSLLHHSLWKTLRQTLVNTHAINKVSLLPQDTFQCAEVESAIVFLSPYSGSSKSIDIDDYRFGSCIKSTIDSEIFIEKFHGVALADEGDNQLGSLLTEMYRGRSCSKELRQKEISHLHSSDVNALHSSKLTLPTTPHQEYEKVARAGDILVARVGTRCLGSAVMIQSGQAVISDSVISIRVPKSKRNQVFKKITSASGQDWLKRAARGACAKIITYNTLERFPLEAI